MSQTTIIVIAVIVVVLALLLLYLLRGRKQHVTFDAATAPRAAAPAPAAPIVSPPVTPAPAPTEGHDVTSEIAAAVEDVVDQFMGIEAHASGSALPKADALTQLKGLGPKAASRLAELGVTHLDQIASWNEADVAALDAQMGAFKGRIVRDKWVEQAKLLTAGDTEAFEAQFGKLG